MASLPGIKDARSDGRAALLSGLIDDAGLFPPAELAMDEAVTSHVASKLGPHGWMMGRFLCPASRLPELLGHLPERVGTKPWGIGVILDRAAGEWGGGGDHHTEAVRTFEERAEGAARVELLEARLPDDLTAGEAPRVIAAELRSFAQSVDRSGLIGPVAPFFEVPLVGPRWRRSVSAALQGVAKARAASSGGVCLAPGAKLRCGGLVPEAFPSPEQVAAFVSDCARLSVPFKATAGLHHPFRHTDGETGFVQHGFVNLVGASILTLSHRLSEAELAEVLADEEASDFDLTAEGFRWRSYGTNASEVARAREVMLRAYGSCSFSEPVEDLRALGILPVAA